MLKVCKLELLNNFDLCWIYAGFMFARIISFTIFTESFKFEIKCKGKENKSDFKICPPKKYNHQKEKKLKYWAIYLHFDHYSLFKFIHLTCHQSSVCSQL